MGRHRSFQKRVRIPPRAPGAQSISERPYEGILAFPERPWAVVPAPPSARAHPCPLQALGILGAQWPLLPSRPLVALGAEQGRCTHLSSAGVALRKLASREEPP